MSPTVKIMLSRSVTLFTHFLSRFSHVSGQHILLPLTTANFEGENDCRNCFMIRACKSWICSHTCYCLCYGAWLSNSLPVKVRVCSKTDDDQQTDMISVYPLSFFFFFFVGDMEILVKLPLLGFDILWSACLLFRRFR